MIWGFSLVAVFVLCLVFFLKISNTVNLIILSEFFILSLIYFFVIKNNSFKFFVVLILLLVGVCEAAMGLSFVVTLIRKKVLNINTFL